MQLDYTYMDIQGLQGWGDVTFDLFVAALRDRELYKSLHETAEEERDKALAEVERAAEQMAQLESQMSELSRKYNELARGEAREFQAVLAGSHPDADLTREGA